MYLGVDSCHHYYRRHDGTCSSKDCIFCVFLLFVTHNATQILYHFGGVYVDADMECLASLDDLHESISTGTGHLTFYTGFSNTGTIELNNGLIG